MNLPRHDEDESRRMDDLLIDRLVDGEMGDAERRDLLHRLECEPGGWRRCALAFLEAQAWGESLTPLAALSPAQIEPVSVSVQPARWRLLARRLSMAAALLTAFALGWTFRHDDAHRPAQTPVVQIEPQAPPAPKAAPGPEQSTPVQEETPARPNQLARSWEQDGYRIEQQARLISMELANGRRVDVPVREMRVRYVGDRMY